MAYFGGITDLDVTYGAALAPPGFHKITFADGSSAELNRGYSGNASYLWTFEGGGRGDPIVDILISHSDGNETIEGYEKVNRNLLKGSNETAFLYFKRGKEQDPIGEIKVVYGGAKVEDDFTLIEPSISREHKIHLAYKRISKDKVVKWSGYVLKVNDWVDAKDSIDKWCVAQVCEADENNVRLHFKGWSSKWDETLPRNSNKLAELGTHTSGKDTGWGRRQQGGQFKLTVDDLKLLNDQLSRLKSQPSNDANEQLEHFWRTDIADTVDSILTSTFPDIKVLPKANAFLMFVLRELSNQLAEQGDFNMGKHQLLERILCCDENFNWYYTHYGLGSPDDSYFSAGDFLLDGPITRLQKNSSRLMGGSAGNTQFDVSRLLITNINFFGQENGFARIISRLDPGGSHRTSLQQTLSFVQTIKESMNYFSKKSTQSLLPELAEMVFKRLNTLSNDDLRELMEKKEGHGNRQHVSKIDTIDNILKELEAVMRTHWKDYPIYEKKEKFKLEFCKRLLTCKYLNLRIRGVSMLTETIEMVQNKELASKRNYGYSLTQTQDRDVLNITQWLSSTVLSQWILQSDIIDVVLGDPAALQAYDLADNHVEILKRSQEILLFIASTKNGLNEKHIQMLWKAGHPSASVISQGTSLMTKAVYKVLTGLIPKLSLELVMVVVHGVKLIPLSSLDNTTVELIKSIVEHAVNSIGISNFESEDYGMSVLWTCAISGNNSSQSLACDGLSSILSKAQAKKLLTSYLEKCCNEIKTTSERSRNCVLLLQKIIDAHQDNARVQLNKQSISQEQLIQHCEEQHHIVESLFANISVNFTRLKEVSSQSPTSEYYLPMKISTSTSSFEITEDKKLVIRENIITMLSFLQYALMRSNLELDFEQIKQLWKLFESTGCSSDLEQFFEWLHSVSPNEVSLNIAQSSGLSTYYSSSKLTNRGPQCISDNVVKSIYFDLFGAVAVVGKDNENAFFDVAKLGLKGYLALENIFRYLNGHAKKILHCYNQNHFTVNSADLLGVDVLVNAYLLSSSPSVVISSADFIISLQLRLSNTLDRKTIWSNFTKYCMSIVQEISKNATSKSATNLKLNRMLSLLGKFLHEVTTHVVITPNVSTSYIYQGSKQDFVKVTVFWKREGDHSNVNASVVYMFKSSSVTIGAFRSRLAKDFHTWVSLLKMVNGSRTTLTSAYDNQLLEAAGVSSFIDLLILRKPIEDPTSFKSYPPARTLAEDPESEQMLPRKLLSNQKDYLQLLFSLLSDESVEVSQAAWNLLDLLPTNIDIMNQLDTWGGSFSFKNGIVKGSKVDWADLLSSGGLLRQQYKLKVISSNLNSLKDLHDNDEMIEKIRSWSEAFVTLGGLDYLFHVLFNYQWSFDGEENHEGSSTKVEKECMDQLLHVIIQFIHERQSVKVAESRPTSAAKNFKSEDSDKITIIVENIYSDAFVQTLLRRILKIVRMSILPPSQGGTLLTRQSSAALDSNKAKRDRRRSRVAKLEQYFSSNKNTSSAISLNDSAKSLANDPEENDINSSQEFNVDSPMIDHTFELLISVTKYHHSISKEILGYENLRDCLRLALLYSLDQDVRNSVANGILKLAGHLVDHNNTFEFSRTIFAELVSFLNEALLDSPESKTLEYFDLLSNMACLGSATLYGVDKITVCNDLADFIKQRQKIEITEEDEDTLLISVMRFTQSLLSAVRTDEQSAIKKHVGIDKGLVYYLFNDCLFCHINNSKNRKSRSTSLLLPKCKSAASREAAFLLWRELCVNCIECFQTSIGLIKPHHSIDSKIITSILNKSNQSGSDGKKLSVVVRTPGVSSIGGINIPKCKAGYTGLFNPGCICYMNSTLQQLFMIPEFRKGILEAETDVKSKDDPEAPNDIMFQLQLLFAYLQESEKAYVDPRGFCHSFKDYEGQPTDTMIQQDASEFLANLFQQIESHIMGSRLESLLKETIGGMLSNELLAEGGRHSERPEPFFLLSVPVGHGVTTLKSALERYVGGDTVDYTWEDKNENGNITKQSLATTKRVSIKTLPSHLFIHLSRFEFDFEAMQQIKINDRFEFPLVLDMFPYTVEGRFAAENKGSDTNISDENVQHRGYTYELSGVVVHVGTAQSGHYFSYIKERTPPNSNKKAAWFEFNDSFVTEFDLDDLEDETFGGEDPHITSSNIGGTPTKGKNYQKLQNAFMLIYDRIITPESSHCDESIDVLEDQDQFGANELQVYRRHADQPSSPTHITRILAPIPEYIEDSIYNDNINYWRTRSIYSHSYFRFLSDFLMQKKYLSISKPLDNDILLLGVNISLGTVLQAKDKDTLSQWVNWLISIFNNSVTSCSTFLQFLSTAGPLTDMEILLEGVNLERFVYRRMRYLLLEVDDFEIRGSIMRVITTALETLLQHEEECKDSVQVCVSFVSYTIDLLREANLYWRNIDHFFDPVTILSINNEVARVRLVEMNCIAKLLSFFLAHESPCPELLGVEKLRQMSDGYLFPDYRSLLRAIGSLLPLDRELASIKDEFSQDAKNILTSQLFTYRLIRNINNADKKRYVCPIVKFMLKNSEVSSKIAVEMIISSMKKEDGIELKPALRFAMIVLEVRDDLSEWRTNLLLASILSEMQNSIQYIDATEVTLMMFLRLAKYYPVVKQWIKANKEKLRFLESYLQVRKSGGHPQGSTKLKPRRGNQQHQQQQYINTPISLAANAIAALKAIYSNDTSAVDEALSGYDSDEDPVSLISRRVKIRWSDKDYPGTISSYNESTGMHTIQYDDGDVKACNLAAKSWAFIK